MSKVEIKLDTAGVGELLRSDELKSYLEGIAKQVSDRAGSGYRAKGIRMPTRAIAVAEAADKKAIRDNLKNNTLLKAMGGLKND